MRRSQKIALGGTGALLLCLAVGAAAGGTFRKERSLKSTVSYVATQDLAEPGPAQDLARGAAAKAAPPSRPGLALGDPALEALAASQKLIRTGTFVLEVGALDEALGRIQRIAAEQGGYIADLKSDRKERGRAHGTVVLRVLPGRYFQALDQVRALGRVASEGIQTQDVTRAYADLEARLRNKRDLEARMREILRTRTAKLSDLMEAEHELAKVTEEIERMEGERRYYQQMTGFSTLTLELYESLGQGAPRPTSPWEPLRRAFQRSGETLVETLALLVLGAATLLPWGLLAGAAWALWRRRQARAALKDAA